MFDFDHFVSILNSLIDHQARNVFYGDGGRVADVVDSRMVFDGEQYEGNNRNALNRFQALRAASAVKILGKGVIKVVHRVDDAKENNNLDLSGCQLIQVPDAIYFMMKEYKLTACNLSSNVITKIPPKFPNNFNLITELNLSHNRMSTLPEEISKCTELETVDISHNSFISLPNCLFNLPKITKITAKKNFIAELDFELVTSCETLETLNLEENPLSRECQDNLSKVTSVRILMTPGEMEEWEDLSI